MTKKLSVLLVTLVLLPSFMVAQKRMVLRSDGQKSQNGVFIDGREIQATKINKQAAREFFKDNNNVTDLDNVLFYTFPASGLGNANFGFFGQDWFVQWFEAPADMSINRAGFNVNAVDAAGFSVALKLVTVNWTKDQILNAGVTNWGYYVANGNGYNDITAFTDNNDITGGWVDVEGSGQGSPFGADLWSNSGYGVSSEPIPLGGVNVYQWIDMSSLGFNPSVAKGTIVGVAVHNNSATMDADRVGMLANNTLGIPGFKFYTNGRLVPGGPGVGDPGWWTRAYTWDFALDVTLTGDTPPDINSYDVLATTLSTADRTVNANITDENPSGGAAGVASASLLYSVDRGASWTTVAMTGSEPDFSAVIPGQAAGTEVSYYITATDVAGNASNPTSTVTYTIFQPTSNTLLVFNGYTAPSGYPQSYYFGYLSSTTFDHDVWSYGALTADLLNHYRNVIEIATTGRHTIDNDAILAWLNADAGHNYAAFGDEWIGTETGWFDGTYGPGNFFFDILGITADHNDISWDGSATIDGTTVYPQPGTLLGGPLKDKYNQISTDNGWTAPMLYSPQFEISVTNWLDGVDFANDVQVDMTGDNFDGSANYSILGHRTLPAGNKIVFGTYDPLSLDSDPTNQVEYYWYGADFAAPQVTLLNWFGILQDANTVNVTIDDLNANCDSDVDIPIKVDTTDGQNIISFQFDLNYDTSSLTPFDASSVIDISGTIVPGSWSVLANTDTPDKVIVAGFSATPLSGSGTLLKLKFHTSTLEGTSNLTLTNFMFNNGTPSVNITNGLLDISCGLCGDADEDGSVYALDAAKTLQAAIGLITLTPQGEDNADVDMGGSVSAFDAALILRHVIGLPEPVTTCFEVPMMPEGLSKANGINLEILPLNLDKNKDKTVVEIGLGGITSADNIYSLEMEVELQHEGSLNISGIPSEYVSGINQIDGTHYKVAIIAAKGISTDKIKLRIEYPSAATGTITFNDVKLNDQQTADITSVNIGETLNIKEYKLVGSYPNPFNPSTKIVFEVPQKGIVKIEVYDILGRLVSTLINTEYNQGHYEVTWNGINNSGKILSSGTYIAVMKAGNYQHSIKMNLLK